MAGAAPYFRRLRLASGRAKEEPSGEGNTDAELGVLLVSPLPLIVGGAGGAVLLAILYLMVFEPH